MSSFRFSDKDRGAAGMVKRIGSMKGAAVDVGVLGERAAQPEGDGVSVADVATMAEYGLGQPERSWCRGWVDENEAKVKALSGRAVAAIAQGKVTTESALTAMGLGIAGGMQERIANHIDPPNAPSTVRQKGSSTPLVRSGQFRSSIAPRVVKP